MEPASTCALAVAGSRAREGATARARASDRRKDACRVVFENEFMGSLLKKGDDVNGTRPYSRRVPPVYGVGTLQPAFHKARRLVTRGRSVGEGWPRLE
jgi:hypothetical protein